MCRAFSPLAQCCGRCVRVARLYLWPGYCATGSEVALGPASDSRRSASGRAGVAGFAGSEYLAAANIEGKREKNKVMIGMNRSQAVVLVYHGYAGTSATFEQTTGFSPLADQQDFLAVYPQGMIEPRLSKPFFAELGPIDYGVDEVSFASDMLNALQQKFCIDAHRIYSTGFSNGGGLSALFACRFAGRIAAIAPVEGPFNDIPGGCHPVQPVSVLDIHGTNDQSVPYNGIPISKDPPWPYPAIQQWLQD